MTQGFNATLLQSLKSFTFDAIPSSGLTSKALVGVIKAVAKIETAIDSILEEDKTCYLNWQVAAKHCENFLINLGKDSLNKVSHHLWCSKMHFDLIENPDSTVPY